MPASPSISPPLLSSQDIYQTLLHIIEQEQLAMTQQFALLERCFGETFVDICKSEQIPFNNLYSRMAYVEHRHKLPRWLASKLHSFRIFCRREKKSLEEKKEAFELGGAALLQLIQFLTGSAIPERLLERFPEDKSAVWYPSYQKDYQESIRVTLLEIKEAERLLKVKSEKYPGEDLLVQYDVEKQNQEFTDQIELITEDIGLPCTLQLLKVKIDHQGIMEPRMIIIEPDYLVDISAISESFQPFDIQSDFYPLKKYLPYRSSLPILVGNIANTFLDELLLNPQLEFKDLVKKIFQLQPLALVNMTDEEVRELVQQVKIHYGVLKQMVLEGFPKVEIEAQHSILEPTFFSSDHGMQGRLDLFYPNPDKPAIVELKSGSVYKPNTYGLARNHYTQTLLYDLLIKFTFKQKIKPTNYILYSKMTEGPLRFAPPALSNQAQAMVVRNDLVFQEFRLAGLSTEEGFCENNWLLQLTPQGYPKVKGFHQRDLMLFANTLNRASLIEKKYFFHFTSFIAREQLIAKIGNHGSQRSQGQAALWLDNIITKRNRFDILEDLYLTKNESAAQEPLLHFERKAISKLSNFRKGDIVIFYAEPGPDESPLHHQLFKGTIILLEAERIIIRLRYKQFNTKVFENGTAWRAEHDMMDVSFTNLHRSLFKFISAPNAKKELILGLTSPTPYHFPMELEKPGDLSDHQYKVLQKALTAKDYFLLWGPPGTGKTSVLLRHLVKYILSNDQDDLMLLAYTNRAVDEMCEAIEQIHEGIRNVYLRIGSRYSTKENFVDQLLQVKLETIVNRAELNTLIKGKRIIVGTVASMLSKPELFKLKNFGTVIIDEASQILEPMLAGLLPNFKKFILIGDHQQLPAVVLQNTDQSIVEDKALHDLGLYNLRHSLFERLFKRARALNWHWAFDRLNEQGRLHEQLMQFSNQFFYEGCLDLIPNTIMGTNRQTAPLFYSKLLKGSDIGKLLGENRVLFINTPSDLNSPSGKTNQFEADLIAEAVTHFLNLYHGSNKVLHENSIGIITPYRAQIATIQGALQERNVHQDKISIDTVERYQGGARDIILLSLCTNSPRQLKQLISTSDDGIDRKLNVAITRSKEQLIIFGNEGILSENELYRNLIFWANSQVNNS